MYAEVISGKNQNFHGVHGIEMGRTFRKISIYRGVKDVLFSGNYKEFSIGRKQRAERGQMMGADSGKISRG